MVPRVEEYWQWLQPHLRRFSPEEQRAAVVLYRELAKGQPVDAAQFSGALAVSLGEARALLERDSIKGFVYPDDQGRVLGFGGLAAAPMHHHFEVDGRACGHGAPGTACLFPKSWGRRRASHHRTRKRVSLCGWS